MLVQIMMLFQRPPSSRGLSILESLVVLCTSLILIITLVPVALVQMGLYKLPEPEITPKPILINGKAIVDKEPASLPVPSPSSATMTAPQATETPETAKPPVSAPTSPPEATQKPAASPAGAPTKP